MDWDATYQKTPSEELDHQYSPSRWSKRMGSDVIVADHAQVTGIESGHAKRDLDCELDIPYGKKPKQKLDIFGSKSLSSDAPIFVYIHGGYWQFLEKEKSSFMAPTLVKAGAVVIPVGYEYAPQANMDEIVTQIKEAVTYIIKWAVQRGSRGVYISGHSAGAHLAAMMLSVDWMTECNLTSDIVKGAVLVSGVFDLRPIVYTYVNDPLKMTSESAWNNSPCKHVEAIAHLSRHRNILIAVGEFDSPSFIKQSQQFEKALDTRGLSTRFLNIEGLDHFNIVENLRFEDNLLLKEVLTLLELM
ncbi:kynurenine formamidase-like [Mizuhopecten yessoensis]|uniref:Kynurenine formamidase n=1 Tax=Mizuhopecten yessoensis TaxID=6573 RepID=A0A210QA33_MIZYE|nr:kynurenine formamidase-like [Mizuhopecten yessoensis]OWF45559.1 Kynurenine formamidase [Mizuhopecten yessoensis]